MRNRWLSPLPCIVERISFLAYILLVMECVNCHFWFRRNAFASNRERCGSETMHSYASTRIISACVMATIRPPRDKCNNAPCACVFCACTRCLCGRVGGTLTFLNTRRAIYWLAVCIEIEIEQERKKKQRIENIEDWNALLTHLSPVSFSILLEISMIQKCTWHGPGQARRGERQNGARIKCQNNIILEWGLWKAGLEILLAPVTLW